MSMTKIVNEALKTTVKEGSILLEINNFEDLSEYLEKTYKCSHYETFNTFHLVFYSNSGAMFSVQNTLYEGYSILNLEGIRPQAQNASNTIAEFELLTDKDGGFSMMEAHDEFIKETKVVNPFDNDTGVYSYREFCGSCGMCIKTVLVCPICGGRS